MLAVPLPPGRRARLTIVPAAVAAAAAWAPARWHWEEKEEGRASSGECGARWELQPKRRCRRLGGLQAAVGRSRGTPRASPSASRPRPRPRPDPGAHALQARWLRCGGRNSVAWPSRLYSPGTSRQLAREGQSPRCLRESAAHAVVRLRGTARYGAFLLSSCCFHQKGLEGDV